MSQPLKVLLFTDVLCLFAYGGDARFREMRAEFGDQIAIDHHFVTIYGDVRRRIARSGNTAAEYGAGAVDVAARFPHVEVHPELFARNTPTSAVPAHLFLSAVKLLEGRGEVAPGSFDRLAWEVRLAFFRDLVDVSRRAELFALGERFAMPVDAIQGLYDSGEAFAELAHDQHVQRENNVAMSPALVLNEGRQLLNGNVGYRVIRANLRELLERHSGEASWC